MKLLEIDQKSKLNKMKCIFFLSIICIVALAAAQNPDSSDVPQSISGRIRGFFGILNPFRYIDGAIKRTLQIVDEPLSTVVNKVVDMRDRYTPF